MFGLSSLVYVRDYLQGMQSQQKPLIDEQVSDKTNSYSAPWHSEASRSKKKEGNWEPGVVEDSPAILSPDLSPDSALPQILSPRTNTSPKFPKKKCLDQNNTLVRESSGLAPSSRFSSRLHPLSDLSFAFPPQVNIISPGYDHVSQPRKSSPAAFQQRKVGRGWDSRDLRERLAGSPAARNLIQDQPFQQSHVFPLSPAARRIERTSSPAAQVGSKTRRLSPLRESNGNIQRSSEIHEPGIVVKKTRNPKRGLHSSKPLEILRQPTVSRSSLKSFLSHTSSFAEDYHNGTACLGRYRTPSTPELRFSQFSIPVHQIQPLPRCSSLTSLKHLPPDKKRRLYIGVNNHRLLLPSNLGRSIRPFDITYRTPRLEERNIPAMNPNAIVCPGASNRPTSSLNPRELCAECTLSRASRRHCDMFVPHDAARRNYSIIATAGSEDLAPGQMNNISQNASPAAPIPKETAAPPGMSSGNDTINPNENNVVTEVKETVPFLHLDTASLPRPTNSGFFVGLSEEHKPLEGEKEGSPKVNLRLKRCTQSPCTVLTDHDNDYACWHIRDIGIIRCTQKPCLILTDHDEDYICWHPESVGRQQKEKSDEHISEINQPAVSSREFACSISSSRVRNQAQRSVSFVEVDLDRAPLRLSATYRHSTSLSDPIFPSPLISPRLRGPSFSKEFEENMLTLPMPPVEHSAPFSSHRFSTVSGNGSGSRSIISLSRKPKGFWAKVKDSFKGCFCAS